MSNSNSIGWTTVERTRISTTLEAVFRLGLVLLAAIFSITSLEAADDAGEFEKTIQPLLKKYCQSCHGAQEPKGELNLAAFSRGEELASDAGRLQSLLEALEEQFMPPTEAKLQPSPAEREKLLAWLREQIHRTALASAGEPGKVVIRRLTNAELNYTLTDLTGIERDWTRDFPRDSSGGEGFSNTGQTLQMSASQIEKYLALAQQVADHAFLLPGSGPVFSETPVTTVPREELARLTLDRLDQFCRSNHLKYTDITPREQLTSYAYPDEKSPKKTGIGHLRGYKPFSSDVPGATLSFVGSTYRLFYRTERLNPTPFTFMIHRGHIEKASQSSDGMNLVNEETAKAWNNLWLDFRSASGYARPAKISLLHRWFSLKTYRLNDDPELEARMKTWKVGDGKSPNGYQRHSLDPNLDLSFTVNALVGYLKDIRSFVPEELRIYGNIQHSQDRESRTLMVPNHDAFDAFLHLSLTDAQIEQLWQQVCNPNSQLSQRLGQIPSEELQAEWNSWTEQQQHWEADVLPAAKNSLCQFASRAWRRPLTERERQAIELSIARAVNEGQSLAEAMQFALLRVLMSPHFLYRMEFGVKPALDEGKAIRALDNNEIASRLSYFLWSSIPDKQLRDRAQRGELTDPKALAAEARRMLKDPKIRRFSREMFGQWLGFYEFPQFDRPDRERFPEFDAELRQQMDQEAMDFCTDLISNNRDIRTLLSADYSFLSLRLAKHYGVPEAVNENLWKESAYLGLVKAPRISLAGTNRRGVLGWGAILTATSHPLRTSPVLRGNWILADLLGIPTPPPPNGVPELPEDEKNDSGLSMPQLLARHRSDQACAVCHDRIDPLGLALEAFDPVGRYRNLDLNGKPIDTRIELHDGTTLQSAADLVGYLLEEKQVRLFTRRFCRKMLGYALGRAILPGDGPLLDEIETKLKASDYEFGVIVEAIVTSRQFRHLQHDVLPTDSDKVMP